MATITSLYTCHEELLDENDNQIGYYEENLPHSKEIAEAFITQWNESADEFMLKLINEQAGKDRIKSCYARQFKKNSNKTIIAIDIVAKNGMQLREPTKSNIFDFINSQMSDGWGEGFFGYINIMTDAKGQKYCVQ